MKYRVKTITKKEKVPDSYREKTTTHYIICKGKSFEFDKRLIFKSKETAENVCSYLNEYEKRFELKITDIGKGIYIIWDNETDKAVPFIPIIDSSDHYGELKKYVGWLNDIYEGKE